MMKAFPHVPLYLRACFVNALKPKQMMGNRDKFVTLRVKEQGLCFIATLVVYKGPTSVMLQQGLWILPVHKV
jgi:hypothetical protein